MNDLISRSTLIECIEKRLKNSMIIGWLRSIIDDAPAVDAVEVVRCKDCKYCNIHEGTPHCIKAFGSAEVALDDYCSYGERRADNG